MRCIILIVSLLAVGCNQPPNSGVRAQFDGANDSSPTGDASSAPARETGTPRIRDVEITSFEECVKAGYPVMRSLPAQCRTNEGLVFVDKAELPRIPMPGKRACTDKCGDGQCDEMVCMAVGCPCAETKTSCPEDCK